MLNIFFPNEISAENNERCSSKTKRNEIAGMTPTPLKMREIILCASFILSLVTKISGINRSLIVTDYTKTEHEFKSEPYTENLSILEGSTPKFPNPKYPRLKQ